MTNGDLRMSSEMFTDVRTVLPWSGSRPLLGSHGAPQEVVQLADRREPAVAGQVAPPDAEDSSDAVVDTAPPSESQRVHEELDAPLRPSCERL
jgi:hypothetical protein